MTYTPEVGGVSVVMLFSGIMAVDTFQYFAHRTLPTVPWLYREVHKDHHKYPEPFSFSGLYNSFAESFACDARSIVFATLACGLTASESMLLATAGKTLSDHSCGYMIPYTFSFSNSAL